MTLRIVHLYPAELGINGDGGNVDVLAYRARARGHDVDVIEVGVGGDLPAVIDLVHIGSGPFAALQAIHADALRHGPTLRALRDAGVPILAVGAGWELLGTVIRHEGGALEGLGIFPSAVDRESTQSVAETVVRSAAGALLAGFANHSARTTLDTDAVPLGDVVRGFGNDGSAARDSGAEGVRVAASVGTHLHGCVLGMNPQLADDLLHAALSRQDAADQPLTDSPALRELDDRARRSREALQQRVGV